jgi:hypothetical protein
MNTSTSADSKGVTGAMCWQESNCVGWADSEGVRRTARRADIVRGAPSFPTRSESAIAKATAGRRRNRADSTKPLYHIGTVRQVITRKWFVCSGIAKRRFKLRPGTTVEVQQGSRGRPGDGVLLDGFVASNKGLGLLRSRRRYVQNRRIQRPP